MASTRTKVFHWHKLYRDGLLDVKPPAAQLMPMRITDAMNPETDFIRLSRPSSGTVHLELGRARLRVEGSADPECLRMILEHFGR
jgi:hypothetical protein